MKQTILTLAILIFSAISISAQSKAEQEIRQFFSEVDAMIVKDDVAAMEKYTADDLIFIGTGGRKWTKAEQIENIKKGTWNFASVKREIESIRVTGDTAIIVSHIQFTGKNKQSGSTFNGSYRNTSVLAKRSGKWMTISTQSTRDEPQPDEKELNKLMDDYAAALVKNSANEAEKFLAGDYLRVGPDGSTANKEQHLAAVRSGDLKYQSIEITDRKWNFKAFGNVAIVSSKLMLKANLKGQDVSGAYRLTTVLNRAGVDRWVIALTHISPLAPGN